MRHAFLITITGLVFAVSAEAKPAHLKALADYVGPALPKSVNDCRTCHLPDTADEADKPHNVFGKRVAEWRKERKKLGLANDIPAALDALADEDADKDGVGNLIEILTGHFPGEAGDVPTLAERAEGAKKLAALRAARADYVWDPFQPVKRPGVPRVKNPNWIRNPIDAFVAEQHEKQGLKPRPEAPKAILLRRVYLDLVGLPPTPEQLHAFLNDPSADAYERVVDRLLRSPQYGEAQARHWMDVWRYSDWAGYGNEVRDSQPHIWRWRDWIVESLNADKGYDQMVREMLAGDEIAPDDPNTLRATGFLVRNWYKFSRDIVLDRMVEHTSKAFLGVTLNCAKCHDHMYDPVPQTDFYAFRAIFAPHDIRIDRLPGQPDTQKDGLVHVFDANPAALTYLYIRGNEKDPDTSKPIPPAVPASLRGPAFEIKPVSLPPEAFAPDSRDFVLKETRAAFDAAIVASRKALPSARARLGTALLSSDPWSVVARIPAIEARDQQQSAAQLDVRIAELKWEVFLALLAVEAIDQKAKPDEWKAAATKAGTLQREQAVAEANKAVLLAKLGSWQPAAKGQPTPAKKLMDAEAALAKAEAAAKMPPGPTFTPRAVKTYPPVSTGRRLALANWIVDEKNPLAARVAVNHLWLRRFGTGLVPTVFDFGKNGQPPTHPKLLDWLAAELMTRHWSLKEIHRLITTSATYRMDAANDSANAARDVDNRYLWRMNPRRMTAEQVRDSVLFVAGELDLTAGGPEIDHNAGMTVKRRSLYFRHAPEKQMTFLELFDAASPTECYKRSETVVPQQALALANSPLTQTESRVLARKLSATYADDLAFVSAAFEIVLSRPATADERDICAKFLTEQAELYASKKLAPSDAKTRARDSLVHVLLNHNDFVTVR
jgi:Protein of unknown function (DUF1553)/Protein of unknown function (DUF1549)